MTPLQILWNQLKFVSDSSALSEEQQKTLLPVFQQEAALREMHRVRYLLQRSGIKRIKLLENFNWSFNPKLPHQQILAFWNQPWITETKNLVLIGPSGVGKSHLASAFCYQAIQQGFSTAFITCFDLVNKLKRSANKLTLLHYYATVKVLCLDELGYVFPAPEEANDIFQIVSKRSELAATIVTTNLIPSQWGKIFEAATATAILDRLNQNGSFITFEGRSYRGKK